MYVGDKGAYPPNNVALCVGCFFFSSTSSVALSWPHFLFYCRFVENKKLEQTRRFLAIYSHSVKWDLGEFFCPLCASFCNTVCPLLPLTKPEPQELKAPSSQLTFPEWRDLVVLAQKQAESAAEGSDGW